LGDRKLLRARAGATAPAAGVVKGRRSVPIGEGWRLASVGHDRPITHARACVAASLRCGSDRRLRVGMPAQTVHACVYVGAGAGVGARVKTRGRGGASSSARWGYHCRCRGAPAFRGFATSATRRKPWRGPVVTRGVRTPRVDGGCRHGATPCDRAGAQVEAWRQCL